MFEKNVRSFSSTTRIYIPAIYVVVADLSAIILIFTSVAMASAYIVQKAREEKFPCLPFVADLSKPPNTQKWYKEVCAQ